MSRKDTTEYHAQQFLEQGRYLRGWSKATLRTYQQNLRTLQNALGDASLTKQSLQGFVVGMRQKGHTAMAATFAFERSTAS